MNQIQTVSNEDLELLKQFDTPTICNVIELFEIRSRNTGYMDQRIKSNFPEMPPMVGYATTATFRSNSPPRENDVYSGIEDQIDQFGDIPEPRIVVFQDLLYKWLGTVIQFSLKGYARKGSNEPLYCVLLQLHL